MKRIILISILFFGLFVAADTLRSPENQLIARAYVGVIHVYQAVGRPLLDGKVVCRFRPTCSDYSIQAVQKHGIWRGFYLTIKRLAACQNDVQMGTIDEVP